MLKAFSAVANAIRTAVGGLLQIVGPTAGTTRTMTVPDANFTAARTDAAQTFTGVQTFGLIVSEGIASSERYRGNATAIVIADGASITINSGFGGLLTISLTWGDSAHFYCPYGAATSLIRSDSANGASWSATDAGTAVRVFKSNNTSTVTIKNSTGLGSIVVHAAVFTGF